MKYTIQEKSSIGKIDDLHNEDAYVITPDFIAVVDGSTSKGTYDYGSQTSGHLAMTLVCQAIQHLRRNCNIQEAARELSEPLAAYYIQHNIVGLVSEHADERLTCSAVIYSVSRNEIWQIGDCPCLIGNQLFENNKYWEAPLAQARSFYLEKELAEGKTIEQLRQHDTGRDYILPLLRYQTHYQNNAEAPEYAFAVIDGFNIPDALLKVYDVDDAQVVLASDGYFKLFPTLHDTEDYTRRYLQEDPLCMHQHKATKGLGINSQSFDDRTYVRFRLDEEIISDKPILIKNKIV